LWLRPSFPPCIDHLTWPCSMKTVNVSRWLTFDARLFRHHLLEYLYSHSSLISLNISRWSIFAYLVPLTSFT
jgi:hypothetical protein